MPRLLHRLIDKAAMRRPDATAARCEGEAIDYQELVSHAGGLAHVLLETGLKRRSRVAVLLRKGFGVPISFYATFAAGGVLVPIDPKSPVEQVVRILRATGATHFVTEPGKRDVVCRALAEPTDVTHVIGLGNEDEGPEPETSCSSVPWSVVFEESGALPDVEVIELDPCYVLHTSGSTGVPKLIRHTHASAMSFVEWAVAEYGLSDRDRLSNHSSHHTCFATFDYYAAAHAGASTLILTPEVMMMPASLAALLEQERLSVWYSVPTALVQLSLRGDLGSRDLKMLRWVLFAGETFPEKHLQRLMRQLPDARFSHVYGSTEVNVCTYYHLDRKQELSGRLPIGRACPNSATLVVDDALRPVPDGGEGELLVRGSTLMSGYWGEAEKSARALVRRPCEGAHEEVWFRTGDQVRREGDGNLTFVARADLQVKVRGHRVELGEVETALLGLEAVEEAAAFAVPNGEGSNTIRAAVVATQTSNEREIQALLKGVLPAHSVPERITLLEALPRTPTGKVDRNALLERVEA